MMDGRSITSAEAHRLASATLRAGQEAVHRDRLREAQRQRELHGESDPEIGKLLKRIEQLEARVAELEGER
jgi:hypothetical protein